MTQRILQPRGTQALLVDSHPTGCARTVQDMIDLAPRPAAGARQPVVLVIGSSAGYGLAAAAVALFTHQAACVGVCYERPATAKRTASAGWYRTRALAEAARVAGVRFAPINGDGFDPATKKVAVDRFRAEFGPVDYLIYSVAAPRRTDPVSGQAFQSVIKPIGQAHTTKTLAYGADGSAAVREQTLAAATAEETAATVKVMGGEDWAAWVHALAEERLLAPGFKTVALTYVGSDLTGAIYRHGTIGHAKAHLEATATRLNAELAARGGAAFTSVNGAVVTHASTAIPGIALYVSLLRAGNKDAMQTPLQQGVRLFDHLQRGNGAGGEVDGHGRLRLDDWELDETVQADVHHRWKHVATDNVERLADPGWFHTMVRRLYGFDVPGVDYAAPVEVDLP